MLIVQVVVIMIINWNKLISVFSHHHWKVRQPKILSLFFFSWKPRCSMKTKLEQTGLVFRLRWSLRFLSLYFHQETCMKFSCSVFLYSFFWRCREKHLQAIMRCQRATVRPARDTIKTCPPKRRYWLHEYIFFKYIYIYTCIYISEENQYMYMCVYIYLCTFAHGEEW